MEDIIKEVQERLGEILLILVFSTLSFVVYMLAPNTDTLKTRVRGAFLGFFISLIFSYPVFLIVGAGKIWTLIPIAATLTISGQFLPELIQSTFKKYATNKADKFTRSDDK